MRVSFSVAFAVWLGCGVLWGQELETDRPDQTESSSVVPVGRVQIETGAVYEIEDLQGEVGDRAIWTLGSTLVRIGALDRLELRFVGEYVRAETTLPHPNGAATMKSVTAGVGGLAVGAKVAVAEEDGLIPETALIGHLTLPIGAEEFKPDHVIPDFRFSMSHTLSEIFSLGYNLGGEWDDVGDAAGVYTVALGAGLADDIGAYIELFGAMPVGETPEHSLDGGLTYRPAMNMQVDLSAGVGITDPAPDYYLSVGFSARLPQ